MKYKIEMLVDIPRDKFLELFEDMDFMKKWQKGFVSLEPIEGIPGTVGAKSKLTYIMREKETIMIETIIKKDLPDEFNFTYEAKGVMNWANNQFIDKDASTLWVAEHEFKFSGIMGFLSKFMKKLFINQTTNDMQSFKEHAEHESISATHSYQVV